MPKIKVVEPLNQVSQIDVTQETFSDVQTNPEFVTKSDLNELTSMFGQLQKQINPDSALSPEVRSIVKAVEDVQGLKNALKDPTSRGIEEATSTLVTTVLGNALTNMVGPSQQVVAPESFFTSMSKIAVHNISANLPQILESAKSVLGSERIQQGYDAGLKYVENKQASNDFVNTVMSLDENNDEHVNYYAQQIGYTNFDKARNALIEHKVVLYQEQQEYQDIQQGQTQQMNPEVVIEEPTYETPVVETQPISKVVVNDDIEATNTVQLVEEKINIQEPLKVKINKKSSTPLKIKVLDKNKADDELDDKINEIYDDLVI